MANFNASAYVTDEGSWGSISLWGDAGDPRGDIVATGPMWHDNPKEVYIEDFSGGDSNYFNRFSLPEVAGNYEVSYASYTETMNVTPEAANSATGNIGFGWNGDIAYPDWSAVNAIDPSEYVTIDSMEVGKSADGIVVQVSVNNQASTELSADVEFTVDIGLTGSIDGSKTDTAGLPAGGSTGIYVIFDVQSEQDTQAQFCTEIVGVA